MKTAIDKQRYAAIINRTQADFVFAVRSTKIYCRPTCPARRPKRSQILFFDTCDEAEQQGFRACRRCHPRQADTSVEQACRLIESNLEEKLSLRSLASRVGLSQFHLQRKFKRMVGVSPREYADICRFRKFKKQLKRAPSITGAVYAAGYTSSSRAYERTKRRLGMTPMQYRHGAPEVPIRYTTTKCALGHLLVAATDKGICTVSLAGTATALEKALHEEFPAAPLQRDGESLKKALHSILRYLESGQPINDLPLDIQGTSFQWRVWRALQEIPSGETRTYTEIAKAIGSPASVRAVARACATNPVALVIPCHRVIRQSGHLAGYRWGLKRKEALLKKEQQGTSKSSRRRRPDRPGRKPLPALA